jgi:hypothetical protein
MFGRQILTPFAILAVPLVVVMTSAAIFAPVVGYIGLRPQAAILWTLLLPVFWVGGLVVMTCFVKHPRIWLRRRHELCKTDEQLLWLVFSVAALFAIVDVTTALEQLHGLNVVLLVNRTDRVIYTGSALHTQMQAVLQLALVLFTGEVDRRRWYMMAPILACICLLFLTGSRGVYVLPIVGGLLYRRLTGKFTHFAAKAAGIAFAVVILSTGSTVIAISGWKADALTDSVVYADALDRTFSYLWAGVLPLGEQLASGAKVPEDDRLRVYAPMINIWRRVTGTYETSYEPRGVLFSPLQDSFTTGEGSNVNTLFGTVYLYRGWLESAVVAFLLGSASYGLYMSFFTPGLWWCKGIAAFFLSGLFFGWFEYYYWHGVFVSVLALGGVLQLLSIAGRTLSRRS